MFVKEAAKALSHSERAAHVAKTSGRSEDKILTIGNSPQINLRLLSIIRNISSSSQPEFKLALLGSRNEHQVKALIQGTMHAGLVSRGVRRKGNALRESGR